MKSVVEDVVVTYTIPHFTFEVLSVASFILNLVAKYR